jgi:hypothetical protein
MVTRNRAQLILVAGIGIALIVVGMAVVVNTVLFTESVRTSETTTKLGEADEFNYQTRRTVRSIGLRVNHRSRNHTSAEIGTWVQDNISRWSRLSAESAVTATPTVRNVTYNVSESTNGTRIVQTGDGTFESPGSNNNWEPLSHDNHRVGWFVMNLNMSEIDIGERFHANASNKQGDYVNVTLNKTSQSDISINTSLNNGDSADTTCLSEGNRVLLNLHTGQSFSDDSCVFNGTAELTNVSRVHLENGDKAFGKYSLVTNQSAASIQDCTTSVPQSEPCNTSVVWKANITTSIVSEGFSYRDRQNVTVYGGNAGG